MNSKNKKRWLPLETYTELVYRLLLINSQQIHSVCRFIDSTLTLNHNNPVVHF